MIKCPFCQNIVTLEVVDAHSPIDKRGKCKHLEPFIEPESSPGPFGTGLIWVNTDKHENIISYGLNIMIDGKLYGFDSDQGDLRKESSATEISTCSYDDEMKLRTMKPILTFNYFTPLKDNIEYYQHEIKRILNLKAFL